jgi:hypothetical protein
VALTAQKWVDRVLAACGRPLQNPAAAPDAFTQDLLDGLGEWVQTQWDMEAEQPTVKLRYLYTLHAALEYLLGQLYPDADARIGRGGVMVTQSQPWQHLQKMQESVWKQILAAEKKLAVSGTAAGAGGPCAGVMTREAPWDVNLDPLPTGADATGLLPDPNSPLYGGHPLAWPYPGSWRGRRG